MICIYTVCTVLGSSFGQAFPDPPRQGSGFLLPSPSDLLRVRTQTGKSWSGAAESLQPACPGRLSVCWEGHLITYSLELLWINAP